MANPNINPYPFLDLFNQADFVVKTVMILLLLASVFSWSLIIDKFIRLKITRKRCDNFEQDFSSKTIEEMYRIVKTKNNNPFSQIFFSAMKEWKRSNIAAAIEDKTGAKKISLKERISGAMHIAISKNVQNLETGLNMLAIIGSSAPFIGLFGTVWGIMNSFQSIALMKNTNLAVVAPGIAEALLATGIGLFVAIPAVFFYNVFIARINRLYERGNNFSTELLNILSRGLDD